MSKAYDILSGSYDALNTEIDYTKWADFIEDIFSKYSKDKISSVVDLGCGTGLMTFELCKRGYDMIGIDSSEDMLAIANEKNKDSKVLLLNQDMVNFELFGTVDAAISCLDCVNHIINRKDLNQFFYWVHNYLNPNGLFIFDCNSKYKFENVYGNESYILESDNSYCGWQNSYNKKTGICTFYLSLFEKRKDGTYKRKDVIQKEKYYSIKTLDKMLEENGFGILGKYSDYNYGIIDEKSDRWYYIAKAIKS